MHCVVWEKKEQSLQNEEEKEKATVVIANYLSFWLLNLKAYVGYAIRSLRGLQPRADVRLTVQHTDTVELHMF